MPVLVVRHAKAGDRSTWTADDRLRPLTPAGRRQADALVGVLAQTPFRHVISSPYARCVETVEPLARSRGLVVETDDVLAEGHSAAELLDLAAPLSPPGVLLCTHGDVMQDLVEGLVASRVIRPEEAGIEKGCTWVLDLQRGRVVRAHRIPAP